MDENESLEQENDEDDTATSIVLSDDEIIAAIADEEARAYGYLSGDLSAERAKALDYYYGNDYGNEEEGRSQVKTSELSDVIESIMPSLMKVFAGGEQVVKFTPRSAEDVEQAEQESDYINYLVLEKNYGFQVIYNWFKDALLQKNGYVIADWEEQELATEETYKGLKNAELAYLLQDPKVEVIEYENEPDEYGDLVHNVKVKIEDESGELKIYNIPPEEMLISVDCPSPNPKDANFVQWRTLRTISEIRELGYDIEDDIADDDDYLLELETTSRNQYQESVFDQEGADPTTRRVVFKRSWVRLDVNKDGFAELLFICHVGKKILHRETVDMSPVSCITPIPVPHRHIGRSYADLIMDLQLQKSTMLRQVFDNMYISNNGRTAIDADNVNLDDLLNSKPGGVVRTIGSPSNSIMPLVAPQVAGQGFQMLEYIDSLIEVKTGVTKYNQGMDANSLNKTASGISQIMGAAQQRIELVSRIFAETGVKDLFQTVHAIVSKHAKKQEIVQLRNKWVVVDPRQWAKRTDMTVTVGLGTGNKDQQLSHLMNMLAVQEKGLAIGITSPEKIYNTVSELSKNAGFKDADKFWTNPAEAPPKPPQPDPAVMMKQQELQMKAQESQAKFQADQQQAQVKLQMDAQQAQSDNELEWARLALEKEKLDLEREKLILDRQKAETEAQLSVVNMQNQQMSNAMANGNFNDE